MNPLASTLAESVEVYHIPPYIRRIMEMVLRQNERILAMNERLLRDLGAPSLVIAHQEKTT